MEECPKCGHWCVDLSLKRKSLLCYRQDCDYEKPLTKKEIEEYFKRHDVLPYI